MPESHLILTGFMGSGKSSVGKVVAELLGKRFIDLDAEIIVKAGCSINDIFACDGEEAFREMESAKIEQILSVEEGVVLATGGGAVVAAQNRVLMHSRGIIINLKVTPEQVMSRLKGCSDRPLLTGDDVASRAITLMKLREQFYAEADIRIDTDGKSVEDVAAEILCRLRGFSA